MKGIKKIISMFLCCTMIAAVFTSTGMNVFAAVQRTEGANDGKWNDGYFNQYEDYWKDVRFPAKSTDIEKSMYESGCGIFSFCNAIRALNIGITTQSQVKNVASWANDNKFYNPGQNSTLGTFNAAKFYNNVETRFGQIYYFKIGSTGTTPDNRLIAHLQNGSVATCHISSHYICLAGYRNSDNKFHVIESAISRSTGEGSRYKYIKSEHSYLTASQLKAIGFNNYWIIEPYNIGTIKNIGTAKMLNVNGSRAASGTAVSVYKKDSSLGQDFKKSYFGNNKWQIVPLCATSNCLKANGRDGVEVVSSTIKSEDSYLWYIEKYRDHEYLIRSAKDRNLVLTASGTSDRSPVLTTTLHGTPTNMQLWDLGY